jgi:integrase
MSRQSFDVKIWDIRVNKGKRKTTYTVRWVVGGQELQDTFATRKLAESFRAKLTTAAREGEPFEVESGLPLNMAREKARRSWYDHACAFVDMKWPHASPRHRKSIADALATVTPALLSTTRGMPNTKEFRHVLYTWSFNTGARAGKPSEDVARVLRWVETNTVDLADMADPKVIRKALDGLALTQQGKAAAPTTIARKRAVFYGALRYAVELGYFDANPIDRVQWTTPKSTEEIDRRVVVNPSQARELLAAVRKGAPTLEAFYACLYYAALRPAEALHLRDTDCKLPDEGNDDRWGELLLTGSTQLVGVAWGDSGNSQEDQGLKHRATTATRVVPACPELVSILRHHLATYGTGKDGRLFVPRVGKFGKPLAGASDTAVSVTTYTRVWREARTAALKGDAAKPLARRPYDLRHACVSLWLNAGVPATQVAEWAGHSVAVLLRVYAKCIYGQEEAARLRIQAALGPEDDQAA